MEEPKFVQNVAKRISCLGKALETLLEDQVNVNSSRSTTFLEEFLRYAFQADTSLNQVRATLLEDSEDESHFKWACARGKLRSDFPYKKTFPNYEVGALSTSEAVPEVAPIPEASVKEIDAPEVEMGDAPKSDEINQGKPK